MTVDEGMDWEIREEDGLRACAEGVNGVKGRGVLGKDILDDPSGTGIPVEISGCFIRAITGEKGVGGLPGIGEDE